MQTWALQLQIGCLFHESPSEVAAQCWNVVDRGSHSGDTMIMGLIPAAYPWLCSPMDVQCNHLMM